MNSAIQTAKPGHRRLRKKGVTLMDLERAWVFRVPAAGAMEAREHITMGGEKTPGRAGRKAKWPRSLAATR